MADPIRALFIGMLKYCVLLGAKSWIYIIQFDVFVQNVTRIRDCSRPPKDAYQEVPVAKIKNRGEFSESWMEIVLNWGYLEILITAGYFGENGSKMPAPLLGSSLLDKIGQMLRDDEYSITVLLHRMDPVSSTRFLHDYTKNPATKRWSF